MTLSPTAPLSQLARILTQWKRWSIYASAEKITVKQIRQWYDKRSTTGFPEPVEHSFAAMWNGRAVRTWDVLEVLIWFTSYKARRGRQPGAAKTAQSRAA